jgi:hypothetical protein
LRSLWRTLALAWLGGIRSQMLTEDPMQLERLTEERPAVLKPEASAEGTNLIDPLARDEQS